MSNIEWTDCTWNPVIGCTPVSPGCLNCYAATMARRLEAMGQKDYAPSDWAMYRPGEDDDERRARVGGLPAKTIRITEVKNGRAVFTGEVRCLPHRLTDPLRWKKPRRVFVNSMSDLFHEAVPFEFVDRVFGIMLASAVLENHRHTYQVLTKRPERMAEYLASRTPVEHLKAWSKCSDGSVILDNEDVLFSEMVVGATCHQWDDQGRNSSGSEYRPWGYIDELWPLPNVWLGASVEDQARADERVLHLLRCPAAVRFLSVEPLLGPVNLRSVSIGLDPDDREETAGQELVFDALDGTAAGDQKLDWVIAGGESGPNARPCDVAWLRSVANQCKAAGVPLFLKQLGAKSIWSDADAAKVVKGEIPAKSVTGIGDGTYVVQCHDRKGGDPAEWPEDLRVREWPKVGGGA